MNKRYITFVLLLFINSLMTIPIFASAFSLGQVKTVSSDGAVDVIRNPALISLLPGSHSMGLLLDAGSYYYISNTLGFFDTTYQSLRGYGYKQLQYMAGTVHLSYAYKSRNNAVGVAVSSTDSATYEYKRDRKLYKSYDFTLLSFNNLTVLSEQTRVSPSFIFSYARKLSKNHAVGFQLKLGYIHEYICNEYVSFTGAILDRKNIEYLKIDRITSSLAFGYVFSNKTTQLGLMITSGRFSLEKPVLTYSYNQFSSMTNVNGKLSNGFYLLYDEGVTLSAGGYKKIGNYFAFALEGQYSAPFSYIKKYLLANMMTSYLATKFNGDVENKGKISIKGGIEVITPINLIISLGTALIFENEHMLTGNEILGHIETKMKSETYIASLGIDYKLNDKLHLSVGMNMASESVKRSVNSWYLAKVLGNQEFMGNERENTIKLNNFLGVSFSL